MNSILTLRVEHNDPVDGAQGFFGVTFWLLLKVDTGDAVGVGTSAPVTVAFAQPSLWAARLATAAIAAQAQKQVDGAALHEIIVRFPGLISELAAAQ
jgi:hypothetical protein